MGTEPTVRPMGGRERLYPTGFPIRCTHEEKREIFARAERANRSASRFLVESGLLKDGQVPTAGLSPAEITLLEGLLVHLRRVGTNLNELARREHDLAYAEGGSTSDVEVREVLREVGEMLNQLRSRLA